MEATVLYGARDIRFEDRPEPTIIEPTDAVIRLPFTCICGSDLHIYDGYIPTMQPGDVRDTFADISAIERDLGFSPATTIDEGVPLGDATDVAGA